MTEDKHHKLTESFEYIRECILALRQEKQSIVEEFQQFKCMVELGYHEKSPAEFALSIVERTEQIDEYLRWINIELRTLALTTTA